MVSELHQKRAISGRPDPNDLMQLKFGTSSLDLDELCFTFISKTLRESYGYMESVRDWMSQDSNKNFFPTYTYPCIEYLNAIDWTDANVFEYGGGTSSLFWLNQQANVYVVDHMKIWADRIINWSEGKISVDYASNTESYINAIYKYDFKFDVIIIDGGDGKGSRYDCVSPALEKINDGGIIIFDTSELHTNTKELLDKEKNFIPVHFNGFQPRNVSTTTTSCYIHRNFNRPMKKLQPLGGTINGRTSSVDKPRLDIQRNVRDVK